MLHGIYALTKPRTYRICMFDSGRYFPGFPDMTIIARQPQIVQLWRGGNCPEFSWVNPLLYWSCFALLYTLPSLDIFGDPFLWIIQHHMFLTYFVEGVRLHSLPFPPFPPLFSMFRIFFVCAITCQLQKYIPRSHIEYGWIWSMCQIQWLFWILKLVGKGPFCEF